MTEHEKKIIIKDFICRGMICFYCPFDYQNGHIRNCDEVRRTMSLQECFSYFYESISNPNFQYSQKSMKPKIEKLLPKFAEIS